MRHEDRLAYCELCKNKGFSPKSGVICALTSERPSFEISCQDFAEDPQMITKKRRLEESFDRFHENSSSVSYGTNQAAAEESNPFMTAIKIVLFIASLLLSLSQLID